MENEYMDRATIDEVRSKQISVSTTSYLKRMLYYFLLRYYTIQLVQNGYIGSTTVVS